MALSDRVRGQARSYSGFGSLPNFATAATCVGAGLLANAVYQAMAMALKDRVRGQARSYSGFESSPNFASAATCVGPGLLAKAVYQAMVMARTDRVRGQARSYSGFGSSPNFAFDATSVGAGLNWRRRCIRQWRWRWRIAFAGKRAPTVGFDHRPMSRPTPRLVCAGLLANGVSQLTSMLRLNRFASKPAPTGDLRCRKRRASAEVRRRPGYAPHLIRIYLP
jgi:hypothetical protein